MSDVSNEHTSPPPGGGGGQGDGIWITTHDDGVQGNGRFDGRNIVIDGGPDASEAKNEFAKYVEAHAHHNARIDALIVTHPHNWSEICNLWNRWTAPRGVTSYQSGRCGMHVHVSRAALTAMQIQKLVVATAAVVLLLANGVGNQPVAAQSAGARHRHDRAAPSASTAPFCISTSALSAT